MVQKLFNFNRSYLNYYKNYNLNYHKNNNLNVIKMDTYFEVIPREILLLITDFLKLIDVIDLLDVLPEEYSKIYLQHLNYEDYTHILLDIITKDISWKDFTKDYINFTLKYEEEIDIDSHNTSRLLRHSSSFSEEAHVLTFYYMDVGSTFKRLFRFVNARVNITYSDIIIKLHLSKFPLVNRKDFINKNFDSTGEAYARMAIEEYILNIVNYNDLNYNLINDKNFKYIYNIADSITVVDCDQCLYKIIFNNKIVSYEMDEGVPILFNYVKYIDYISNGFRRQEDIEATLIQKMNSKYPIRVDYLKSIIAEAHNLKYYFPTLEYTEYITCDSFNIDEYYDKYHNLSNYFEFIL